MHPALLSAFVTMQPQLQAAENIRAAQIVGVGTGAMKRHDSRMLLGQWSRQMGGGKRMKPGKPGSPEFEAAMAGAGIKVVTVPPKSADNSNE